MRPALLTLFPMLAAAALVWFGGTHLARRDVESRTPADRDRLFDFADAFEAELDRLDDLYHSHLADLADDFVQSAPPQLEERARDLTGLHAIALFNDRGKRKDWSLPGLAPPPPEVVLEGRGRPLNPANSVALSPELFESDEPHGWLSTPQDGIRIHWHRIELFGIVTCTIDVAEVRAVIRNHLSGWVHDPLTPIRESGERFAIADDSGSPLSSGGPSRHGPAALLIPIRTSFGDWQLQAWDGVRVRTEHDPATLALAGTLAAILTLGGLVLFFQQRRALRFAEERVSFVNRVSHELGAPLTNVALNLDLAGEAVATSPTETRRRLAIVTEEVERLARLVANVLTFSRRERNALEISPQPCVPDEVIAKTLDSFRPALRRRGIDTDCQANSNQRVLLDPDALGQIVGNLISNVEKYAADGRWLGIESALCDGSLVVTVADRGPGIPAGSHARIFRPFVRVHRKVNEGSSGTGLGLTIARELAQRMDGSLEVLESDHGTRFELRVPAPPALAVVKDDESSAA